MTSCPVWLPFHSKDAKGSPDIDQYAVIIDDDLE